MAAAEPGDGSGRGSAPARIALAGNPSDGYGGAVLALALPAFAAEASASPATEPAAQPASDLVEATIARFTRCHGSPAAAVAWSSNVPRGVGLAGSSAIVIAVARALAALRGVDYGEEALAEFALAVEVLELGIPAGLQDRVAQTHGGLTFMEFSGRANRYERLDPSLLPPLLVAWRPDAAGDSGQVHSDLRGRYSGGDPAIHRGMAVAADSAREARRALRRADHVVFARQLDATFDARRSMMELDPRHVEMVLTARACGAAANFTGSGGAIVAAAPDPACLAAADAALAALGCSRLRV